jgi:predicted transcriptional regulator
MAAAKPETVTIRLDPSLAERLDRIAAELSKRAEGTEIPRATASRTALVAGVEQMEERLGLAEKKPKKK